VTIVSSNVTLYWLVRQGQQPRVQQSLDQSTTAPSVTVTSVTYTIVIGNAGIVIDPARRCKRRSAPKLWLDVRPTASLARSRPRRRSHDHDSDSFVSPDVPAAALSTKCDAIRNTGSPKLCRCNTTITFTHVATTGSQAFTNTFTRARPSDRRVRVCDQHLCASYPDVAEDTVARTPPRFYSTNNVSLAGRQHHRRRECILGAWTIARRRT